MDAKFLLDGGCYPDDLTRAALSYTVRKLSRGGEGVAFSYSFMRNQQLWWDNGVSNLAVVSRRLQAVRILDGDAVSLLSEFDSPETLHYLDPPYVRSSRSPIALFGRYEMSDDDHRALCLLVRRLTGKVVLSGYHNPIYDELLADWRQASRAMYVNAHTRRTSGPRYRKTEVLWMNF